ncbi:MAG: CHAT domain-containing protein [Pirellulales bacterium]|nr:CHAT domain-containing protein [Pirellulales bacterium]
MRRCWLLFACVIGIGASSSGLFAQEVPPAAQEKPDDAWVNRLRDELWVEFFRARGAEDVPAFLDRAAALTEYDLQSRGVTKLTAAEQLRDWLIEPIAMMPLAARIKAYEGLLNQLRKLVDEQDWRVVDLKSRIAEARRCVLLSNEQQKQLAAADSQRKAAFTISQTYDDDYAAEYAARAADSYRELLGQGSIAEAECWAATVYYSEGAYAPKEESVRYALTAIERLDEAFPPASFPVGHPATAHILIRCGLLQQRLDEPEFLAKLQRGAAMFESLYPAEELHAGSIDLVLAYNDIGFQLWRSDDDRASLAVAEKRLALVRRLYPPEAWPQGHEEIVKALDVLSHIARECAESARALETAREQVAMCRRLYAPERFPHGEEHLAQSLSRLAAIEERLEHYDEAFRHHEQSLAQYLSLADYGDVSGRGNFLNSAADSALSLGSICEAQQRLAGGTEYFLQALELHRLRYNLATYPEGHADIVFDLGRVGGAYKSQRKFDLAIQYLENALAMCRSVHRAPQDQRGQVDIAKYLRRVADAYAAVGRLEEADKGYRDSIVMLERLHAQMPESSEDLTLADAQSDYARFLDDVGRFAEAMPLLEQCVGAYRAYYAKREFTGDLYFLTTQIDDLASAYRALGRFAESRALVEEEYTILQRLYPPDQYPRGHMKLVYGLRSLTRTALAADLFGDAQRYCESMVDMLRRLYPESEYPQGHEALASGLTTLGELQMGLGYREQAHTALQESLAMLRRLAANRPGEITYPLRISNVVFSLSNLMTAKGDYATAATYAAESLELDRELYPANLYPRGHVNIAFSMRRLALVKTYLGQFDEALALSQESLAILRGLRPEKDFPNGDPDIAAMLDNLGWIQAMKGEFAAAATTEEAALAMLERLFPNEQYPDGVPALGTVNWHLATVYQRLGRTGDAIRALSRSMEIDQQPLENLFAVATEETMIEFFQKELYSGANMLVDLCERAQAAGDREAATVAYKWVLNRKTLIVDSLARLEQARRAEQADPEIKRLNAEILQMRQQLADLAIGSDDEELTAEAQASQSKELNRRIAQAETERNRRLAGRMTQLVAGQVEVSQTQAQLAPGTALVEYFRYDDYDFDHAPQVNSSWLDTRYVAFVTTAGSKEVVLVDLGLASEIDLIVNELRSHVERVNRSLALTGEDQLVQEYRGLARQLAAKILDPLEDRLSGAKTLLFACDGTLSRVPLHTLVDQQGNYLIEDHRVAYLASGRDLLRERSKPATGTVLLADPDFNLAPHQETAPAADLAGVDDPNAVRSLDELRGLSWDRLKDTAVEGREISKLLSGSDYGPIRTYQDAAATEEQLKELAAPRVLHLATHGYYIPIERQQPSDLGDLALNETTRGGTAAAIKRKLRAADNPLLRSGFVLAGANVRPQQNGASVDDGWVTAQEVALLDLRGTELVVLSACETGLGDVAVGRGVAGLRSAFLYAGAESMMTSLFRVPSASTQALMTRFYQGLRDGKPKLDALCDAQRDFFREGLRNQSRFHPFFWGSFVLIGRPD